MQHAEDDDQRDAEIDGRLAVIEAEHEVAEQQGAERRGKGNRAAAKVSPAEQRHRADRREVRRVRHEPQDGSDEDRGEERIRRL